MSGEVVIATHALTKRYRETVAVDRLDLSVRQGEVYGFLGRNGAGKTTTIRMLLGLIRPTAGRVGVLGHQVRSGDQSWLGQVGFLVESASAYPNLSGIEATWPAFESFVVVIVGAAGMIVLAFVLAFLFGREYEEATAKNMLALPVSRHWFALAKLLVAALWWAVLVVAVLVEVGVIGAAMRLPGWSPALGGQLLGQVGVAALLAFLLSPLIAWITVATRSAVGAIGFALAMLLLGNVLSQTGWADWFPWSIVFGALGTTGPAADVSPGGAVVLVLTFAAGVVGTILQLRWADNSH